MRSKATIVRRIEKLLILRMPAPESESSRQLRVRLASVRERVRQHFEANGWTLSSDREEPLPPIPAGAFRGMTPMRARIYLLHRGRERNYRRWLAAQKQAA